MTIPVSHLTVLGALGDLADRLLLPGIAELAARDELPADFWLRGVGREPIGVDGFKAHAERALGVHAAHLGQAARRRVIDALDYRAADLQDLPQARAVIASERPTVVYAALPPSVFPATVAATAAAGLPGGSTLAVEKPFGRDLASGRALNTLVERELTGIGVARIDHFLADELPRRIVELRRSTPPVSASWCGRDIERVDVVWDETLGSEGRGYYDAAGALRDVVQNHLLAVLSLVLLEDPADTGSPARTAALRLVRGPTAEDCAERTVRARYTAGTASGRVLPAYVDEPGVEPDRNTETYARIALSSRAVRWNGTTFTLRTGKALPRDRGEIVVTFRPGGSDAPRQLRVGILEPFVRLSLREPSGEPEVVELGGPPVRSPYANVVRELLAGRGEWMVGAEEVEEQWRVVQPVLDCWKTGSPPLGSYAAGTEPRPRGRMPTSSTSATSASDPPRRGERRRSAGRSRA